MKFHVFLPPPKIKKFTFFSLRPIIKFREIFLTDSQTSRFHPSTDWPNSHFLPCLTENFPIFTHDLLKNSENFCKDWQISRYFPETDWWSSRHFSCYQWTNFVIFPPMWSIDKRNIFLLLIENFALFTRWRNLRFFSHDQLSNFAPFFWLISEFHVFILQRQIDHNHIFPRVWLKMFVIFTHDWLTNWDFFMRQLLNFTIFSHNRLTNISPVNESWMTKLTWMSFL